VDAAAHRTFIAYSAAQMPKLAPLVRRLAVVRPRDLAGTVVAGLFHEVIRRMMPCQLHSHSSEAFESLGRADGAEIHAAVETAIGEAREAGAAHNRLRALLSRDPQLALSDAARALGLSSRTLQRSLREAGTSFRAELRRARIDEAKTALSETDDKLYAVARRLGCSSLPQFGRSFRRETGETPGAFRERQRR
jgi:AraC-like DNA-binding protein